MKRIYDYLRLLFFIGGVLIGVQIPGFVDQYGKSLESHYIESSASLQPFRDDAKQYFDDDIKKLVKHYQSNPDVVFKRGGRNISVIFQRNQVLENALSAFSSTAYEAFAQALWHPVSDIQKEVWENYSYNLLLDKTAIIIGLSIGLIISIIAELNLFLLLSAIKLTIYRA